MSATDVHTVIIGGGPSGATAARLLSAQSIETVLIERDRQFNKPCGGGLASTAFSEFSIPEVSVKKRVNTLFIVSPRGRRQTIQLDDSTLNIVSRPQFDESLRLEAIKAGTTLIHGDFKELSSAKDKITVRYIGTNRHIDGHGTELRTLTARYLIAADGVNSRIRKSTTGSFPKRLYTIHEIIAGADADTCEFQFGKNFSPNFYSWLFPAQNGISIGTGAADPRKAIEYLQRYKKTLSISTSGKMRGYHIPIWDGGFFYKNRVFFIGDAAGIVQPFTFEGIYYAMKSAQFAAEAIAKDKPPLYKELYNENYKKRFMFMKALQAFFLGSDKMAETLIALHENVDIQRASLRVWLQNDLARKNIIDYLLYIKRLARSKMPG